MTKKTTIAKNRKQVKVFAGYYKANEFLAKLNPDKVLHISYIPVVKEEKNFEYVYVCIEYLTMVEEEVTIEVDE